METPWQELERTGAELRQMQPCIQGEVHPDAHVLGVLQLGEGSVVLPGTVIEGHVRIGRGCRIGPNAYTTFCRYAAPVCAMFVFEASNINCIAG